METNQNQHFILFKPYGYLSQFVSKQTKRTNKKMLGDLYNFPENTMAIGRLDEPSEGLLLLTTDGKISEFIRSSKIEKEYYAQVDGEITFEAIELLKNGVEINTENGKYLTKSCAVYKLIEFPKLPERAKKIRDSTSRTNKLDFNYFNRRQISSGSKNDCNGWFPYS